MYMYIGWSNSLKRSNILQNSDWKDNEEVSVIFFKKLSNGNLLNPAHQPNMYNILVGKENDNHIKEPPFFLLQI